MSTQESKPESKTRIIVNGPSNMDLMLGLFDNTDKNRRFVRFYIEDSRPGVRPYIAVSISMLERESGSGDCWNFKGLNKANENVGGFYSVKTRKGSLEVELTASFRRN